MAQPGELVHVDFKKLGNVPDGDGWHMLRAQPGRGNSQAHRDATLPRKACRSAAN